MRGPKYHYKLARQWRVDVVPTLNADLVALFIVTPMVFYVLMYVTLCLFLVLQSSGWGRESWFLCLVCLPGVS